MQNRLSCLGLLAMLSTLAVARSTPLLWASQEHDSCAPQSVPAALHDSVDVSVRDFAAALAGAGVSAGFIVDTEEEYEREPAELISNLFPMAALAAAERLVDPRVQKPPVQFATPSLWPADGCPARSGWRCGIPMIRQVCD